MQILHFNTWGLSLPLFFTVLYAIVRGLQTRARGWIVLGAFLLAILFEFRPFAYVVLMAALGAAAVFSGRDRVARWHFVATAALGVLFTTPFLYAAAHPRSRGSPDPPGDRVLSAREADADQDRAHRRLRQLSRPRSCPGSRCARPCFCLLATIVFSRDRRRRPVGRGARCVACDPPPARQPVQWSRCGPGPGRLEPARMERLAGVAIPFVLATEPYVDTLNFYVTGLYVMWIFTAVGARRVRREASADRSSSRCPWRSPSRCRRRLHYLERRWTDRERPARVDISAAEIRIAEYLRNKTDPETTVVLHDRPLSPSLTTILAERRIVLGWDVTYSAVGGQDRLRDVNRFYASADGNADAAFETLGRYRVTHVIVRDDDRVHPDVLARLHLVMQFPGAALYTVPSPAQP